MKEFFASGHAVDFVLLVLAVEAAILIAMRAPGAKIRQLASPLLPLLPGVFLLLALRAALTGTSWVWVALWLACSFPAHLADLLRRPVKP